MTPTFRVLPTGLSATISIRSWPLLIGLPLMEVTIPRLQAGFFRRAVRYDRSNEDAVIRAINLQQSRVLLGLGNVMPIDPRVTWPVLMIWL